MSDSLIRFTRGFTTSSSTSGSTTSSTIRLSRRPSLLIFLSAFVLFSSLSGCRHVSTIQSVQANPHRNWFNSTVYLQGTVSDQAPLVKGQLYELKDSTGRVWVLSPTSNLKLGDQIWIKGQVRYEVIEIAGQNLGEVYIEEQQQLPPD